MSLSRKTARNVLMALGIMATAMISGCTMAPVYGDIAAPTRYAIAYAKPSSRLEQIVYQELALSLGESTAIDAPVLLVRVRVSTRKLTESSVGNSFQSYEATAVASYSLSRGDTVIASGTRDATASYESSPQVLAGRSAAGEAGERAAKAVADSIRLSLIAALAAR
ncbi:MAG: hypothetical protein JWR75_1558 [Devosia sp.]|nr:hypothetical protein [Devosia sp.]